MFHFIDYISHPSAFSEEAQALLKTLVSERSFKKGEKLVGREELDTQAFFIKTGAARVFFLKNGKEVTYNFAFENDWALSLRKKVGRGDFYDVIEFIEDSEVYVVRRNQQLWMQLAEKDIQICMMINRLLIGYSDYMEERMLVLQNATASERYRWVLDRYPKLLQRATLGQVASFLGITQETLSRIRSGKYTSASE